MTAYVWAISPYASHLLYHKWYMDDGAVAGSEKAVARVITILSELGPQLGLFLNVSKCEVFSKGNMNSFPPGMKRSNTPNMEVLEAPIGDILFCAKFFANQRAKANVLLSRLQQVGSKDPQVAYLLLRFCGSFCKMVHLARSTPPSLVAEGLGIFDRDIRRCFTECTSVDVSDVAWMQAQLSPSRGGLGLRSLRLHSSACFIASMGHFGIAFGENHHLEQSLIEFNGAVEGMEGIGLQDIIDAPPHQRQLSSMIEDHQFKIIFDHTSSPANCARLLSVSSPHASAWLSVMPTPHKNLHLDPPEFQMAQKWWLGLDTSQNGSSCSFCPSHALDPLGHHALTCKSGGDSIFRHNSLRDTFWESYILLPNWEFGKPAALDFTITSALNPSTLNEASVMAGFAASAAEVRKHVANDEKCSRLGWVCLNLHLEPNEFQVAIKWWLGMDVSFGSCCPYCLNHRLDPLGHHALTCKHGGDVVLRHNSLRDVFVESCHRACLGGQVEVGSGLGLDRLHFRPADVLVNNWHLGKPAAFDLTVTSPLNPIILTEAGVRCGSSALFAEARKHNANDSKCAELGWVCIPLAVESYGCWGTEAQQSFSRLAARLAIQMGCS
eukprot:Em0050g6a